MKPVIEIPEIDEIHRSRFFPKIKKTKTCWLWTGAKNGDGYGCFAINQRLFRAARIMLAICRKDEIKEGLICLHSCDNRLCVNPDHLRMGTHQENMEDKFKRGRANLPFGDRNAARKYPERIVRGEKHPGAKLTPEKVTEMRKLRDEGLSYGKIAKLFFVSYSTAECVCKRIRWKHIH